MIATLTSINAARAEFHWLYHQARTPRLRSIEEFAASEFVIPKGMAKGTLIDWNRQPFARLFVRELDSGRWRRSAVVGCVQSGKSTISFVLPVIYYSCECREPVIVAAPTMKVNRDKFNDEILPALMASRWRNCLPSDGSGSRGGWAEEIRLTNGGVLKFMSAGGGDENRSSYTARCVVMTEADKMDTAGETSRETDPVSQIEARTESYPEELRRCHLECTVSVSAGRIWTEYQSGTASRIACPCPHCGEYVTPEREHLVGWQDAESETAARLAAYFACPNCGDPLTADQRVEMNRRAKVVHRGQTIDRDGVIHGDPPETYTLGFRWNAFNNLFWTAGEVAAKEWASKHATAGEEALERELCQFIWSIPYQSPDFDSTPLDAHKIRRRFADRGYTRGVVPADAEKLALAIDCGKRFCTWKLLAARPDERRHVVNYGTFEVHSRDMDEKRALLAALKNFRDDVVLEGWLKPGGEIVLPDVVFIDAGWLGDVVYEFCRESGNRFRPAIGFGLSQNFRRFRGYRRPSKTGNEVKLIGEEFHVVWLPAERIFRVDLNVDYWKTRLFEALRVPPGNAGAMEFYHSDDPNEHFTVAKHYTAERQQEVFTPGVGTEIRWIVEHRANHYLDAAANALCALRLILPGTKAPIAKPAVQTAASHPFLGPDGRPYLLTDRD